MSGARLRDLEGVLQSPSDALLLSQKRSGVQAFRATSILFLRSTELGGVLQSTSGVLFLAKKRLGVCAPCVRRLVRQRGYERQVQRRVGGKPARSRRKCRTVHTFDVSGRLGTV